MFFCVTQIQCESFFAIEFVLHFLKAHNTCAWSRVFKWWCKHAKISQKRSHQNWIKWAYISPQVSNSRVNKCLARLSQSETAISRSRFLRAVVPVFSTNQRTPFQWHVNTLRVFPACSWLRPEFRVFGAARFQFWESGSGMAVEFAILLFSKRCL